MSLPHSVVFIGFKDQATASWNTLEGVRSPRSSASFLALSSVASGARRRMRPPVLAVAWMVFMFSEFGIFFKGHDVILREIVRHAMRNTKYYFQGKRRHLQNSVSAAAASSEGR